MKQMSARTDERRSNLVRRARQMDGIGPPIHLMQLPTLPYYRTSRRRKSGHSEMSFDDYGELRSYLAEKFCVDDRELMGYVFGIKMDGTRQVFPVLSPDGFRVAALGMKNGIYGMAYGASMPEAIQKLDNVMRFMAD